MTCSPPAARSRTSRRSCGRRRTSRWPRACSPRWSAASAWTGCSAPTSTARTCASCSPRSNNICRPTCGRSTTALGRWRPKRRCGPGDGYAGHHSAGSAGPSAKEEGGHAHSTPRGTDQAPHRVPLPPPGPDARAGPVGWPRPALAARNGVGVGPWEAERYADAVAVPEPVVEECRHVLGTADPDTLVAAGNLAMAYVHLERWEQGLALLAENVAARERTFGEADPLTMTARHAQATALQMAGRLPEALATFSNVAAQR